MVDALTIMVPVVVALVSALGAWIVSERRHRTELAISDRQQLVNFYENELKYARMEIQRLRERELKWQQLILRTASAADTAASFAEVLAEESH